MAELTVSPIGLYDTPALKPKQHSLAGHGSNAQLPPVLTLSKGTLDWPKAPYILEEMPTVVTATR